MEKDKRKIFEMPDGKVEDYDIKHEGVAVCVLALTKDNNVVLAKQFRPGMEKELLEMPGGGLEGNESPEEAMRRELLEETGYTGELELVGSSYECAYSTRLRYTFVAKNCYKSGEQKLDDTEFVEVVEMGLADFREHLRSGELTDVECGYLGLDYLDLL